MKVRFNERKATQIAAIILKEKGGKMDLIDLMKLIYCVDRKALLKWRWPLTGDRYAALKRGMLLSHTYDLAKGDFALPTFWSQYILHGEMHELRLAGDPGFDELSEEELDLIKEALNEFAGVGRSEMIEDIHHKLPEWSDPGNSSITIPYEQVLTLEGFDEETVREFFHQVEVHSMFECAIK